MILLGRKKQFSFSETRKQTYKQQHSLPCSSQTHVSLSGFKFVQKIQVRDVSFVVRINLQHQLLYLRLAHSEAKTLQHSSEVSFGYSAIFVLHKCINE